MCVANSRGDREPCKLLDRFHVCGNLPTPTSEVTVNGALCYRLLWPSQSPPQPQLETSPGPLLSLENQTRSQLAAVLPAMRAADGRKSRSETGRRTRREQILWLTNWAALARPWAASLRRTWGA